MPVVPGLLFTITRPFDPALTEEKFNDWYNNKHIVDVVNSGLASVAVRYANKNPSGQWPYMAMYRLPDLPKLYDPVFMATVPTDSPMSWGKGYMPDVANAELRGYQMLKLFEAENAKDGTAKVVVTQETSRSVKDDNAFIDLFQKQQFPTLVKNGAYRRSMLYKSAEAFVPSESKTEDDQRAGTDFKAAGEQRPVYLVVHEFDSSPVSTNFGTEKTDIWEYIAEYGTGLYSVVPTPGRR